MGCRCQTLFNPFTMDKISPPEASVVCHFPNLSVLTQAAYPAPKPHAGPRWAQGRRHPCSNRMIISPGRKFIFVHIPKTGGTALTLALETRAMKDDILMGDTPKARARKGRLRGITSQGRLWKHSTLTDIAGFASDADIASFFTVTLVRNPWDRAVSYYHWLRMQGFAHPAVGLAKTHDFSGFLNHPQTITALRLWPYTAYMRNRFGIERASLYARLEYLDSDLDPFQVHLGFRITPLPRANTSVRTRDWRGFYTDADAALLADISADDIARFGYLFDDAAGVP